jgi:hypothetical protein
MAKRIPFDRVLIETRSGIHVPLSRVVSVGRLPSQRVPDEIEYVDDHGTLRSASLDESPRVVIAAEGEQA